MEQVHEQERCGHIKSDELLANASSRHVTLHHEMSCNVPDGHFQGFLKNIF